MRNSVYRKWLNSKHFRKSLNLILGLKADKGFEFMKMIKKLNFKGYYDQL